MAENNEHNVAGAKYVVFLYKVRPDNENIYDLLEPGVAEVALRDEIEDRITDDDFNNAVNNVVRALIPPAFAMEPTDAFHRQVYNQYRTAGVIPNAELYKVKPIPEFVDYKMMIGIGRYHFNGYPIGPPGNNAQGQPIQRPIIGRLYGEQILPRVIIKNLPNIGDYNLPQGYDVLAYSDWVMGQIAQNNQMVARIGNEEENRYAAITNVINNQDGGRRRRHRTRRGRRHRKQRKTYRRRSSRRSTRRRA